MGALAKSELSQQMCFDLPISTLTLFQKSQKLPQASKQKGFCETEEKIWICSFYQPFLTQYFKIHIKMYMETQPLFVSVLKVKLIIFSLLHTEK